MQAQPACLVVCWYFVLTMLITICVAQEGKQISPTCYLPPNRTKCGPHFVIVGSMKSGTTSLYSYLLEHPQVVGLEHDAKLNGFPILANKEIRFFLDPLYSRLISNGGYNTSINQYYDVFPQIQPKTRGLAMVTGEASPMYVCFPEVAGRTKLAYPYGKIIWMMRNPIERAYSDYWFRNVFQYSEHSQEERENTKNIVKGHFRSCATAEISILQHCNVSTYLDNITMEGIQELRECLETTSTILKRVRGACDDGSDYQYMCTPDSSKKFCNAGWMIRNGIYVFQLLSWLQEFSANQLLFVRSEDFYGNTTRIMNEVTDFLGLQNIEWAGTVEKTFNILMNSGTPDLAIGVTDHSEYPPMDKATRELLRQFYLPFNEALLKYIYIAWE